VRGERKQERAPGGKALSPEAVNCFLFPVSSPFLLSAFCFLPPLLHSLEPHPPPAAPPLPRGVAEELGGAAAAFAAPFVGGLYQPGGVEGATEGGLVETAAEEDLVDLLEIAQGEGGGEEAEGNGGVLETRAHGVQSPVEHGLLARCKRRDIIDREPRRGTAHRSWRAGSDESEERYREW